MAAVPKLSELDQFVAAGTIENSYQDPNVDGQITPTTPFADKSAPSSEKEVRVYELQGGDAIVEVRENSATTSHSMLDNPLTNYQALVVGNTIDDENSQLVYRNLQIKEQPAPDASS